MLFSGAVAVAAADGDRAAWALGAERRDLRIVGVKMNAGTTTQIMMIAATTTAFDTVRPVFDRDEDVLAAANRAGNAALPASSVNRFTTATRAPCFTSNSPSSARCERHCG